MAYTTQNKAHSNHYITKPDGSTASRYSRYEVGRITGRYREIPAVLADSTGFDSLGFDSSVGSVDDSWHVVNVFDSVNNYIDSMAIGGAMDGNHALQIAKSQLDSLGGTRCQLITNNAMQFDGMDQDHAWSIDAINKLMDNPSQNKSYLPVITAPELVVEAERVTFDSVQWDSNDNLISHGGKGSRLYLDLTRADTRNELVTEFDLADALFDMDAEEAGFDALMDTKSRLPLLKDRLFKALSRAGDEGLSVTNVTQTKEFKRQGVINIAFVFDLSDGQKLSIWFHKPLESSSKLLPSDYMVSWKWMLNKRDVTAALSPKHGDNVQLPALARRIMRVAAKNSKRFKAAQARKAKVEQELLDAEQAIEDKKATISQLDADIADLNSKIDAALQERKDEGETQASWPSEFKPFKVKAKDITDQAKELLSEALKDGWNPIAPKYDTYFTMQKQINGSDFEMLVTGGGGCVITQAGVEKPIFDDHRFDLLPNTDVKNHYKWLMDLIIERQSKDPESKNDNPPATTTETVTDENGVVKTIVRDANGAIISSSIDNTAATNRRDTQGDNGLSDEEETTVSVYVNSRGRVLATVTKQAGKYNVKGENFSGGNYPDDESVLKQLKVVKENNPSMKLKQGKEFFSADDIGKSYPPVERGKDGGYIAYMNSKKKDNWLAFPKANGGFTVYAENAQTRAYRFSTPKVFSNLEELLAAYPAFKGIDKLIAEDQASDDEYDEIDSSEYPQMFLDRNKDKLNILGIGDDDIHVGLEDDYENKSDYSDLYHIDSGLFARQTLNFADAVCKTVDAAISLGADAVVGDFTATAYQDSMFDGLDSKSNPTYGITVQIEKGGVYLRADIDAYGECKILKGASGTDVITTIKHVFTDNTNEYQSALADALGIQVDDDMSTTDTHDAPKLSVGDKVVWRNDNGELRGIYRGEVDGKVVLVVNGSQMEAPAGEVFADDQPADPVAEPESTPATANSDSGIPDITNAGKSNAVEYANKLLDFAKNGWSPTQSYDDIDNWTSEEQAEAYRKEKDLVQAEEKEVIRRFSTLYHHRAYKKDQAEIQEAADLANAAYQRGWDGYPSKGREVDQFFSPIFERARMKTYNETKEWDAVSEDHVFPPVEKIGDDEYRAYRDSDKKDHWTAKYVNGRDWEVVIDTERSRNVKGVSKLRFFKSIDDIINEYPAFKGVKEIIAGNGKTKDEPATSAAADRINEIEQQMSAADFDPMTIDTDELIDLVDQVEGDADLSAKLDAISVTLQQKMVAISMKALTDMAGA